MKLGVCIRLSLDVVRGRAVTYGAGGCPGGSAAGLLGGELLSAERYGAKPPLPPA
jgi:hypothetical protein